MDANIHCLQCSKTYEVSIGDLVAQNLWPGGLNSSYIFDQTLFQFYDTLQKILPGVSETGFIKTLEHISEQKGRVSVLNA